jgi:hypothetical protein
MNPAIKMGLTMGGSQIMASPDQRRGMLCR